MMNRFERLIPTASAQRGAIMIEAMVTVVISAVGLLGIVGMLLAGISTSNKSYYRSTAASMANEIMERMRANRIGVDESIISSGGYLGSGSGTKVCRPTPSTPVPASCSASELAAYDVFDWTNQIKRVLPSSDGVVTTVDSGAANVKWFEVSVTWLEDTKTGTPMDFKLRFEP